MPFKKIYPWILYTLSLIFTLIAIYLFSIEQTILAISFFTTTAIISTFLVLKNLGLVTKITFLSMIPFSWITMAATDISSEGTLTSALTEQSYMIVLALTCTFFLISSCYSATVNKGWKRTISIILILFLLGMTTLFALTAPNFYINYIYTYPFVALIFAFYLFLTIKGRKFLRVVGILGLFSPLILLFLSSVFLDQTVYTVGETEEVAIVEHMEGKAQEMLEYYNEDDTESFCDEYCDELLTTQLAENPSIITDIKDEYGRCTNIGEADIKKIGDYYYVQYPILFESSDTQYYFVLLLADTTSKISGFYIAEVKY